MTPRAAEARGLAVAAALGVLALQLLAALNPAVAEVDPEELYNAGVAWMLGHGHADALFRMQYREFCGGCSLDAVLGAPVLAALGPRWLAWKLVPIGFSVVLAGAGTALVARLEGRAAAAAFALLVLLPPRAFLHLSLIGWGNHVEAGVVGVLGLLLAVAAQGAAARVAAGAVLGGAVWIGFSGAFAPLAAVLLLARRGRWAALGQVAVGVPLGLLPWAAQYAATGLHPFVTIYQDGEAAPSLARIPSKIGTLIAPGQVVALLGGPRWWGFLTGALAAGSGLVALGLGARDRSGAAGGALAGIAMWLAIYVVVRFQVYDPPWPEIAVPGSVRYAAPLYPLGMVLLATVAGRAWASGRRGLAAMVLAGPLLAGGAARVEALAGAASPRRVAALGAVHWPHFRPQFSYTLSNAEHADLAGADPWSGRLHAYALARNDAGMKLRNPDDGTLRRVRLPAGVDATWWWEGVGEALVDQLDDETDDTRQLLVRAAALLATCPDVDAAGAAAALRAVAWGRREAPDFGSLTAEDDAVGRAVAWARGRHGGHQMTGWFGPAPAAGALEEARAASPCAAGDASGCGAAWTAGLGFGVAEEIGLEALSVRVEEVGLDPATWERAARDGAGRWWLDAGAGG